MGVLGRTNVRILRIYCRGTLTVHCRIIPGPYFPNTADRDPKRRALQRQISLLQARVFRFARRRVRQLRVINYVRMSYFSLFYSYMVVIFGIQSAEDGTHPVSTDKVS